ncbi:MAG: hypothetical protein AB7O66_12640 [Limisphaerales bacterium]
MSPLESTSPKPAPEPEPEPDFERPSASASWRIFAIPGVLALVGYVSLYAIDARLRTTKGPWEVTFLRDPSGVPALIIDQPRLGISNVTVRFVGESTPAIVDPPVTIRFDSPRVQLPFGNTAFDDLMYLPGTVVIHCFGHEVQMLPRAFFLNRKEKAWSDSNTHEYEVGPADKLASLDPPRKGPGAKPAGPAPAH